MSARLASLKITEFVFLDILPRTLGMFLGTTHAGCQILQAVHVQATTSITRRQNPFPSLEILHARNHLQFKGTAIIPFVMIH